MPRIYKRTCNTCGKNYCSSAKKYCSLSCIWKGKKHSEETKKKISMAQLGSKNHRYGKINTTEMKLKQGLKGDKHPFWGNEHHNQWENQCHT
jgi:hypothetical protein